MSISRITSQNPVTSSFSTGMTSPTKNSTLSQLRQQFQQLGSDLQSGNLSAAQSDFATLQQEASPTAVSSTHSNDPVTQALNQLQFQLQAGDLTGSVPRPVANVPIAEQSSETPGPQAGHHDRASGSHGDETSWGSESLDQLGQALQSNNLASAQQAYNSMLQSLPGLSNGVLSMPDVMSQSGFSLSA